MDLSVGWISLPASNQCISKWWNITLVIILLKTTTSVLLTDSLYCLLGLHAWVKQTVMLRRLEWKGPEDGLQPTAKEEFHLSVLQLMKNSELQSYNPWGNEGYQKSCINLEADPFPFKPLDETPVLSNILISGLWETLKQKTQLSHTHFSDPQKLCCFKPLFVLICYTAVDD